MSASRKLAAPTMAILLMAVVCPSVTSAALAASPTPTLNGTPSLGCGNSSVRSGTTHDSMSVAGLDRSWICTSRLRMMG